MDGIHGDISIREASCREYRAEGRIPGASHFGRYWAIPEDAKKPSDPRKADTNKTSRR